MLHDAPCSVLVARLGYDPERFPSRVVVGVDGSPGSRAALAVAADVCRRGGGVLTVVTAGHDQERALAALDGEADRDEVISALAVLGRASWVEQVVPGSRWAHSSGCGTSLEGETPSGGGCGRGYVSEKAQRMLYFFEGRPL